MTGWYLRQTAATTPHLGDKVSDEGVVKYLGGHAALDIAHHRENITTAKQLHQPIHQTPLQLQLEGERGDGRQDEGLEPALITFLPVHGLPAWGRSLLSTSEGGPR